MNELENNTPSLEEMFAQLDEIIEKLQTKDMSLEETFAGYKKGIELVELCNKKIEKVECDIKVISGEGEMNE